MRSKIIQFALHRRKWRPFTLCDLNCTTAKFVELFQSLMQVFFLVRRQGFIRLWFEMRTKKYIQGTDAISPSTTTGRGVRRGQGPLLLFFSTTTIDIQHSRPTGENFQTYSCATSCVYHSRLCNHLPTLIAQVSYEM